MNSVILSGVQTILNREAGKALTCNSCGYSWVYKGTLIFASCPSCRHAVKVRSIKESNLAPRDQAKDQIAVPIIAEGGPL